MDNFIVSARKYRPATFRSVVGQRQVTDTLKNAIQRGQLAHAYLFCGPRGVGKTTCARIFAKAINCFHPVENEACGECESCRSFDEGRSFNIHELDAASNTSVDNIRDLIDQVRVPPQVGRYSVFIIDEVHMLSTAAFNAFLKTLEEPPAHAIFILATTEKHKIIPTILSRCQIYDFNRIKVEDSVDYLRYIASQEGVESDDESLNIIAQKADGAMRDALSMFDKAVAFCGGKLDFKSVAHTLNVLDYDTYFRALALIKSGDYQQLLLMLDEILRGGFSAQTFLSGLLGHLRDLLMCKNPHTLPLLELSGSIAERYRRQSEEHSPQELFELLSLLSEVDVSLRSATNTRLHIELGLMKACSLGEKKNDFSELSATLPPLREDVTKRQDSASGHSSEQPVRQSVTTPSSEPTNGHGATERPASVATPATSPAPSAAQVSGPAPTAAQVSAAAPTKAPAPTPAPSAAQKIEPMSVGAAPPHSTPELPSAPKATPSSATAPAAMQGGQRVTTNLHSQGRTTPPAGGIGLSLASILGTAKSEQHPEGEHVEEIQTIDPHCEEKINAARDRFLEALGQSRPRIATALSSMSVKGNHLIATVGTQLIYEEIMRNRSAIAGMLTEIAGIEGVVEFDITVNERKEKSRPITREERYAHLVSLNPEMPEFIKALELEVE